MRFSIKVEDTGTLVLKSVVPDGVVSSGKCMQDSCEVVETVSSGVVPVLGGACTGCEHVGSSGCFVEVDEVEGRVDGSDARQGAMVSCAVLSGNKNVPEGVGSGTGGVQVLDTRKSGVLGGVLVHPALCDLSPLVGEGSGVMILRGFTGEVFRCTVLRANHCVDGLSGCFIVDVDCRLGGVDLHGSVGKVGVGRCDARILKAIKWVGKADGSLDWDLMGLMPENHFRCLLSGSPAPVFRAIVWRRLSLMVTRILIIWWGSCCIRLVGDVI
jgi:hypothetical protein